MIQTCRQTSQTSIWSMRRSQGYHRSLVKYRKRNISPQREWARTIQLRVLGWLTLSLYRLTTFNQQICHQQSQGTSMEVGTGLVIEISQRAVPKDKLRLCGRSKISELVSRKWPRRRSQRIHHLDIHSHLSSPWLRPPLIMAPTWSMMRWKVAQSKSRLQR